MLAAIVGMLSVTRLQLTQIRLAVLRSGRELFDTSSSCRLTTCTASEASQQRDALSQQSNKRMNNLRQLIKQLLLRPASRPRHVPVRIPSPVVHHVVLRPVLLQHLNQCPARFLTYPQFGRTPTALLLARTPHRTGPRFTAMARPAGACSQGTAS